MCRWMNVMSCARLKNRKEANDGDNVSDENWSLGVLISFWCQRPARDRLGEGQFEANTEVQLHTPIVWLQFFAIYARRSIERKFEANK